MTSYTAFAPFYDEVMGDRGQEGAYVRSLIEKHHPKAKTVLELACGTGAILEQLQPHYEIAGLDISKGMLEIASRKVPQARLVLEDMTQFDLGETFDVVLCVYDSLNHLVSFEQWEAVFDRACEHLAPGGIFIFDVNTERKLASFADAPPWMQWFGDDSLLLIDVRDGHNGVTGRSGSSSTSGARRIGSMPRTSRRRRSRPSRSRRRWAPASDASGSTTRNGHGRRRGRSACTSSAASPPRASARGGACLARRRGARRSARGGRRYGSRHARGAPGSPCSPERRSSGSSRSRAGPQRR